MTSPTKLFLVCTVRVPVQNPGESPGNYTVLLETLTLSVFLAQDTRADKHNSNEMLQKSKKQRRPAKISYQTERPEESGEKSG